MTNTKKQEITDTRTPEDISVPRKSGSDLFRVLALPGKAGRNFWQRLC